MNFSNPLRRNLVAIFFIAAGYAFLWFVSQHDSEYHYTICPFKNITGYPCPGCGVGRATIELYQGHFHESIYYHWLGIPFNIAVIISLVWIVRDTIKNSDSFWVYMKKPMNSWVMTVIIILFLVNWFRALYFGI